MTTGTDRTPSRTVGDRAPGRSAGTTTDPTAAPGVTAGPDRTRKELTRLRPGLLTAYDTALPGARAHVLAQLIGALHREPLPGVTGRSVRDGALHVTLADGRHVTAPAGAVPPFAHPDPGLTVHIAATGSASDHSASDHSGSDSRSGDRTGTFDDPRALLRALDLPGATARLATEVDNSVANLALARAARTTTGNAGAVLDAAEDGPDCPGRLEQLPTDGHPLHPCCRTRGGMSVADVLDYAPEHGPVLRLHRFRVPADRWYGDAPPILYAHPWQADRIREAYPWLTPDGHTGPVRPLMSLRTVAPVDGGDHVKTAVDVQMTSAVRTVSPAAVHNGPRLTALLHTLTADLPTLHVLTEHGAGAVLVDGQPHRGLAHLRRQAPPVVPGEVVLPLAALAAPAGDRRVLDEAVAAYAGDPYAWFSALTCVLVGPMVTVLHRGVALEAHGQNTLVVLRAGRPTRILYRDLGGVRVSATRIRAAGAEPPPVHGDLPTDDPAALRTTLAAALLAGALGEHVALLRDGHDADPDTLWATVAAAIRRTGTPDAAALLHEPLPVKATTAMRLAGDPLDNRWAYLPNPMAGHR